MNNKYEGRQNSPDGWSPWRLIDDNHHAWWRQWALSSPGLVEMRAVNVSSLTVERLRDALVLSGLTYVDEGRLHYCSESRDTCVDGMVETLAQLIGVR